MIKQKKKVPFKLLIWLMIGVAIMVIIVSGGFYLVGINKKLTAPTNIQVLEYSNNQKFLKFDSVAGALKYQYVIINGDTNLNYETTATEVEITSSVSEIGLYRIDIRAIGKTTSSISNYNKINYKHYLQISKPTVSIYENSLKFNIQDIFYDEVSLTFHLSYKLKTFEGDFTVLPLSRQNQNYGTLETNVYGPASGNFDLTRLSPGEYLMYVTVSSDHELYTTSPISSILEYSC